MVFFHLEKGTALRQRARGWQRQRGLEVRRGGRPHLGVAADTLADRACGASLARACAASSPFLWLPASPSCRSRPCGEPSGNQGQPGMARRGVEGAAGAGRYRASWFRRMWCTKPWLMSSRPPGLQQSPGPRSGAASIWSPGRRSAAAPTAPTAALPPGELGTTPCPPSGLAA